MAKKTPPQEIINEFKNYLTRYYNSNQKLNSRRMTMLSKLNCDICDKSTRKTDGMIHTFEIFYLEGVQCCLNCVKKYPEDYYLYIMSLKRKVIPQKIFKRLIHLLKSDIDFDSINIQRSNGKIEIWKLAENEANFYKKDNVDVKVINQENTLQKTNNFETFCKINDINYDEALDLFKQIYFDIDILSWGEYLDTLKGKESVINALNQRYNNNRNYIDQAISVKDEDAVRLMLKYNIN